MSADPFAADRPRVFEIPAGRPFLEDLAAGLYALAGEDPLSLARATVLLPTRRAGRALAAALLRLSGNRSAVLPRIHPLGEVADEPLLLAGALDEPPPIAPLARIALLSRLVAKADPTLPFDRTWRLAVELATLLDELALEEVDPARLRTLVPEDYAAHWQKTLRFLDILIAAWPQVLRERGLSDPGARRVRALRAQIAAWERTPPDAPVIAAGPTSAFPALADLLAAVSRLPRGAVVLPGIDRSLPAALWRSLPESHPQAGLASLLDRMGVKREAVLPWPARSPTADRPDRAGLLSAVFAPPEGLAAWRMRDPDRWRPALAGLARLEAAETQEEAAVVALAVRRALERPGRTVAVVTPDRLLARRIADACARHGVLADDTGGEPAKNAPAGVFLRLLARAVAERLAPIPLLALLKHPFAAAGEEPARFRGGVRALEVAVLRGPRPAPGLAGLEAALDRAGGPDAEAGREALARISPILAPLLALTAQAEVALPQLLEAHLSASEALAARPDLPGPLVLWRGEDGEALARHLADLAEAVADLPPAPPPRFPDLFEAMLEGPMVRLARTQDPHPRVQILGTLEARLQAFDTVILAGLNEGTWPAAEDPGPWLSRPMRRALGLASPERRIGDAARDVADLIAGAGEVLLTRSRRVEGSPTVPSRWLVRLETFLRGQFEDEAERLLAPPEDLVGIAHRLDDPGEIAPAARPAPRPPRAARPRRLAVTDIAALIAEPYAVYARHVLGLRPLDPIDADAEAADFGDIVHRGIAEVLRAAGAAWPEDAEARLVAAFDRALAVRAVRPALAALWRPRLARIAAWLDRTERDRRAASPPRAVFAEAKAEQTITGLPGGPFVLVGRADRIEVREGGLAILDYKTGTMPTDDSVARGSEPQLTLEAALARLGAFPGVPALPAVELAYWKLTGGWDAGELRRVCKDAEAEAAEAAWQGLIRRLHAFDDEATPYLSRPHPRLVWKRSDYAVLARIDEWSAGGGNLES